MRFYNIDPVSLTIYLAPKICLCEVGLGATIESLLNDLYSLKFVCINMLLNMHKYHFATDKHNY